jgi:hypothetical protein
MRPTREDGPWLFVPNPRTGRLEIYLANGDSEVLVGSMLGTATDSDIRGMVHRLESESKPCK